MVSMAHGVTGLSDLQYAKQGSTVHNFMYVCVISTLRNEFNLLPSPPGFYMVTNVTA